MTLPACKNKHNLRVSLWSDSVGMLRVSRSVSQSELHDLEQILSANSVYIFKCLDVFLKVWVPDWTSILHV